MFIKKIPLLILFLLISVVSISQDKAGTFVYEGRVDVLQDNKVVLIGTASSVSFNFTGNECAVSLQSIDSWEHQNYIVLELDGKYLGKYTVQKGAPQSFPVKVTSNKKVHNLKVYKATEATMGNVLFLGTTAKLTTITAKKKKKKKIEFIGDSITCGAANDPSTIPCDEGEYFDHHNGYFAYGPILSRTIDVNYLLSSVSGIGIYRNWNEEGSDAPIMPAVYENLYLTKDTSKPKYDFAFQPEIISIALGTNDFSNGDGTKERLPFSPEKYVSNYISFIKMLYKHNPKAQLVLTNSPMVNGEKALIFENCLKKIKAEFDADKSHKPILIFKFKPMAPSGCSGHPNIEEHKIMAAEYGPFLKKLLNEK
ncbi:SGNH/GDSL hydrolase family protein [Flavobacterium pectinovorum]|uniref:SGNH/GDSL hydrolase family protein n=1 Tax=Flavobacterium pectinovorum TaxID=29533 RepID=UPI001FACC6CB|nr:SGNH/GDSL hydrolase family protein [Flavobacterium pectinovorum]MCI9846241.1 GDSL family lipase [Flavobacterium pectinovorum]